VVTVITKIAGIADVLVTNIRTIQQ